MFKLLIACDIGGNLVDFWGFIHLVSIQTGIIPKDFPENWNVDTSNLRWFKKDPFDLNSVNVLKLAETTWGEAYLDPQQYNVSVRPFELRGGISVRGLMCLIRDPSIVVERKLIPYDSVRFTYSCYRVTKETEEKAWPYFKKFAEKHRFALHEGLGSLQLSSQNSLAFTSEDCYEDTDVDNIQNEITDIFQRFDIEYKILFPHRCKKCNGVNDMFRPEYMPCIRCVLEEEAAKKEIAELQQKKQEERKVSGVCYMCGNPLGFFSKMLGEKKHKDCTVFSN